jgi:DNA processing protein
MTPNTRAILLLTAPLLTKIHETSVKPLTPGEFNQLDRSLCKQGIEPADLLQGAVIDVAQRHAKLTSERLRVLLDRDFQLGRAFDRWQARLIWVVGRHDDSYPSRLKARLKSGAPAVLFGCGKRVILESGGLAMVGSRNVDDDLLTRTGNIARLAAEAGCTVVSGGARGIDQAAMRGALEAGGRVAAVLSDSLERAASSLENREVLMSGRLVLISPYDPSAGFNVGNAMQRNKLIYALSDAALVMSADHEKGGTWAGAVEQLKKHRSVRVFVDSGLAGQDAGRAMQSLGALPWPDPGNAATLAAVVSGSGTVEAVRAGEQQSLF